jgi:hypothetical protein
VSPVQTTLNVGRWLEETPQRLALTKRRLAALGWTDVELDALLAGVDFRDILRGDARGVWLRGEA